MALTTHRHSGRGFTYADLESMPDDENNRYELSYGALVVTPAPNTRHQQLAGAVALFLGRHAPPAMTVLPEAELFIKPDLVKRPDVQVVDKSLIGGQCVTGTPELVVEIHSPSTRAMDLTEKRHVYAEAGVPAYWLIDPEAATLTILELAGSELVERAVVRRGDEFDVSVPFTMNVQGSEIFG